jgi:hypothetical protein
LQKWCTYTSYEFRNNYDIKWNIEIRVNITEGYETPLIISIRVQHPMPIASNASNFLSLLNRESLFM